MENNSNKNITTRLIIKPIHQKYKRNDAYSASKIKKNIGDMTEVCLQCFAINTAKTVI